MRNQDRRSHLSIDVAPRRRHRVLLKAWLWSVALLSLMVALPVTAQPRPRPRPAPAPPPRPIPGSDDADPIPPEPQPEPFRPQTAQGATDFSGSLQVIHGPSGAGVPKAYGVEIFPDAARVWMNVRDTDPVPVERARRGGAWLCAKGGCSAQTGTMGQSDRGDKMLLSIKVSTPTVPLPLTIWGRLVAGKPVLDFDPVLLGRRSYRHLCSYPPTVEDNVAPNAAPTPPPAPVDPNDPNAAAAAPKKSVNKHDPNAVEICHDGEPESAGPDSAEITLGMQWPDRAEFADFRYLAFVDSCGNARVIPFQQTFSVPVFEVANGGCGAPDGKVLRIFPQGGFIRVTAFNLEAPATTDVMNVTYRVTIPPLENLEVSNPARLLFPDIQVKDLRVDCGPEITKAPTDKDGLPRPPPDVPPGMTAPPAALAAKGAQVKVTPVATLGPKDLGPGPQPMDHGSVVISPTPLRQGNCRISLLGQTKRRLVAPLAFHVSLARTDQTMNNNPIELLPPTAQEWIVTPTNAEFMLPPLRENFDGESRLKLVVYSDPLSPAGKVVLLSDAARVASSLRVGGDGGISPLTDAILAQRVVGSVTIHSVPLCGKSNFETLDGAGSCVRAYLTVPAMLATLQLTRAPWVEKPLITRNVLSAVGLAFAFDSYNPVERRAFPIAGQIGGFVEQMGDGRTGLMAYAGIAPTLPILGSGGNTTSLGFLAGAGINYITNEAGPDEGLKPTAFVSFVVQVGQANPESSLSGRSSFGTYNGQ